MLLSYSTLLHNTLIFYILTLLLDGVEILQACISSIDAFMGQDGEKKVSLV